MNLRTFKLAVLLILGASAALGGYMFREHRTYKEAVVVSPAVTEVKKLSDYDKGVKGTVNDANVYIFDSGVAGGTAVIIGRIKSIGVMRRIYI